jgi:hypothetical protein
MTQTEKLQQIRENILTDLADLTDPEKRRPTYSLDGKSVSWGEYFSSRMQALKDINELLGNAEPVFCVTRME